MTTRRLFGVALCFSSTIAGGLGHMQVSDPPPLRSKFNPYTAVADVDWSMTNPLHGDGSDFPCKGYHKLLNTAQGTPVKTLEGGKSYSMIVTGIAIHAGGSCQASLSVDGGQTFRVLHSYIGGCPAVAGDNSLAFRVPSDVPSTDHALLGWSWFNTMGNREMYMNCASVNISTGVENEENGFLTRPLMFTANVGTGCETVDSRDLIFPDPGPDVTLGHKNAVPPIGDCGAGPEASASVAPAPSYAPGPTSTRAVSSAPGEYTDPVRCPAPTAVESAGGSSETSNAQTILFTPGNDWPEGFQGVASNRICDGRNDWRMVVGMRGSGQPT
ncbi:hypothetical protein B0J13DRAFT_584895 [Dactylonectria estremocensis]|uniref:Endoglucanase n=1 Tax=Dactylonectria estremocensis TaxID=1079267 RepID=A0A9P9EVS9_9HYPO|nr:hypothetical protein B0J13DRAFT_584895 [Dactylonectria estremocensis]